MNSFGQKLVDDFDAPALAPVREAFLDGAYFIYGHTVLAAQLGLGYQSAWAKSYLPDAPGAQRVLHARRQAAAAGRRRAKSVVGRHPTRYGARPHCWRRSEETGVSRSRAAGMTQVDQTNQTPKAELEYRNAHPPLPEQNRLWPLLRRGL